MIREDGQVAEQSVECRGHRTPSGRCPSSSHRGGDPADPHGDRGAPGRVSVAQAFHWFHAGQAFRKRARVLRRGGVVGMVWNARDHSVGWVDQVWAVMDEVERRALSRDLDKWRESAFDDPPGFDPPSTATFRHEHPTTQEGVIDRIRGLSHVAALPTNDKAAALAQVRDVLAPHPKIRGDQRLHVPYRVDGFSFRRV